MVIDCIDNLDSKAALVAYCVKRGIRVVVSCGAGMKSDPTRLQIRDLRESTYDDLARALRLKLKKLNALHDGITAVYSNEVATRKLLPLKEYHNSNDLGTRRKHLTITPSSRTTEYGSCRCREPCQLSSRIVSPRTCSAN
jgi:tRNA A37 threonylcarbamoyladenosine dehydratase